MEDLVARLNEAQNPALVNEEINSLNRVVEDLVAQKNALNHECSNLQVQLQAADANLATTEQLWHDSLNNNAQLANDYNALQEQNNALQEQNNVLQALQEQNNALQEQNNALQVELAGHHYTMNDLLKWGAAGMAAGYFLPKICEALWDWATE